MCVCSRDNSVCFCVCVCQDNKQRFLKTFIRDLRKNDKASEMKILNMMNEVNKISRVKIKRSAGENHCRNTTEPVRVEGSLCVFLSSPVETACTAGQILQAQVYSDMFPFAYDVTQFNACLSVQTLKDNLEAVTDRVYDRSYQRIILDKLNQVKHSPEHCCHCCQSQCCHRDVCVPPLRRIQADCLTRCCRF